MPQLKNAVDDFIKSVLLIYQLIYQKVVHG